MKIRFLSGPKKGQITDAPRSQETKLLLDAGVIERWFEPVVPAVVSWGIGRTTITDRVYISATCSRNCARMFYDGPTELVAKKATFFHGCGAMPESCPQSVIDKYAQEKRESVPTLSAEMHQVATFVGQDNKHRVVE